MKAFLISAFVALGAVAMPERHFQRSDDGFDRATDSKAECSCIEIVEEEGEANILAGVYRYRDPLGNTITVEYTYDKIGADYSETRRIDTTSASVSALAAQEVSLDVDEIAARVTGQVRAMLPLIIRKAVADNGGRDTAQIVERVKAKVRSVILGSLRDAISGSTELSLDLEVITTAIMGTLNNSFAYQVEKEIESSTFATSELISDVDHSNVEQDVLVSAILTQLKGLVVETVGTEEKDVAIPTPVVTQVVTQVEKQVGQQHGSQDHNVLVLQVLEELRPVIIQLIAEQAKLHEQSEVTHTVTGGATHVTGDEFNSLEDEYRKGLELMRSDSFATAIESRVRPAVDVELRSIFEQYSSHGDEEIVEIVVDLLRTVIEQEIRVEIQQRDIRVSGTFFASDNYSTLVSDMSTRLEQVIRAQLGSLRSEYQQRYEALIHQVVREVKTTIGSVAQSEVQSTTSTSVSTIVGSILNGIRPSIRESIRNRIESETQFGLFTSDDASFVESIMEQVIQQVTVYAREQVELYLQQRTPRAPLTQAVAAAPAAGGRLQALFGISGVNNIKVDTPAYQYANSWSK